MKEIYCIIREYQGENKKYAYELEVVSGDFEGKVCGSKGATIFGLIRFIKDKKGNKK